MYAARKNFEFYNMLLAAKYAPRKNLEKMHRRQIRAKKMLKFRRKRLKFSDIRTIIYTHLQ